MVLSGVVGARPNFMNVAPIVAQMQPRASLFHSIVVHTGQHYDEKLSRVFFEDPAMPWPDVNLNIGSASHAADAAPVRRPQRESHRRPCSRHARGNTTAQGGRAEPDVMH
jgi:hypothetical protein